MKPARQEGSSGFTAVQIKGSVDSDSLFAEVRGIKIYQPVTASYLKELL